MFRSYTYERSIGSSIIVRASSRVECRSNTKVARESSRTLVSRDQKFRSNLRTIIYFSFRAEISESFSYLGELSRFFEVRTVTRSVREFPRRTRNASNNVVASLACYLKLNNRWCNNQSAWKQYVRKKEKKKKKTKRTPLLVQLAPNSRTKNVPFSCNKYVNRSRRVFHWRASPCVS